MDCFRDAALHHQFISDWQLKVCCCGSACDSVYPKWVLLISLCVPRFLLSPFNYWKIHFHKHFSAHTLCWATKWSNFCKLYYLCVPDESANICWHLFFILSFSLLPKEHVGVTAKGGSGISDAPPPLLVEPPAHPTRDPSFPRTGASTFTSVFATIFTFLSAESAIKVLIG